MKVVLQRVQRGGVTVADRKIGEIKLGLVIFLGVGPEDTKEIAESLARKISRLRIFEDEGEDIFEKYDLSGWQGVKKDSVWELRLRRRTPTQ